MAKPYGGKINTIAATDRTKEVWAEDFDDIEADIETLEDKQYAFIVSDQDITIPTTEVVVKPNITEEINGLSYDSTSGELTINRTGQYHTNITANIDALSTGKTVELWLEVDTGSGFNVVEYSGFIRTFPNQNEVEAVYVSSKELSASHKYRIKGRSDTDTGIVARSGVLTNGSIRPSIKVSISN